MFIISARLYPERKGDCLLGRVCVCVCLWTCDTHIVGTWVCLHNMGTNLPFGTKASPHIKNCGLNTWFWAQVGVTLKHNYVFISDLRNLEDAFQTFDQSTWYSLSNWGPKLCNQLVNNWLWGQCQGEGNIAANCWWLMVRIKNSL